MSRSTVLSLLPQLVLPAETYVTIASGANVVKAVLICVVDAFGQ
jgi:hypothetical protein